MKKENYDTSIVALKKSDTYTEPYADCYHCLGTDREPIPFSELGL